MEQASEDITVGLSEDMISRAGQEVDFILVFPYDVSWGANACYFTTALV